jgi:hypothetical protein
MIKNTVVDPETLRRLYHGEGLTQAEIGERFGVTHRTIGNWMMQHGIPRRPDATKRDWSGHRSPRWVPYAGYKTNAAGYEVWRSRTDGRATVLVHRLAAVAWFGYDAVAGNDVHHRNDVPWDNREVNLRPMDPSEHRSHHAKSRERDDGGNFV